MRRLFPPSGFSILLALTLVVVFIRLFLFSPYTVHGESMSPSLKGEERIIVNKLKYRIDPPDYGEIVVFQSEGKNLIKRVIGLPGDVIHIENGYVFRNGKRLEEPYINEKVQGFLQQTEVIKDHVFVLGDNRNNSLDSRQIGLIPMDQVVGRADFILFPFEEMDILIR